MKQEIIKRLKEAGFQKKYGTGYVPELDELMSACGNGFFSLGRDGSGNWRASMEVCPGEEYQTDIDVSPKDAVANLWLLINCK